MRRPNLTPALVVLALLSGCARCGAPRGGPPPERFVPATDAGTVVIPVIAEAARQVAALHGALAARPGGEDLGLVRTGLGQQLTFDVFDPESLRGAGLDVQRGLAIAELATRPGEPGTPLLVLPVGDAGRLEAQVTRLAKERLGAGDRGQQAANGVTFTVWRRAAGEPALLSVAQAEGSMLVAVGPDGPEVLRVVLALDPAVSLAESPSWKRGRAALGDGLPLLFFAPRDAPALLDLPATDGVAAGLSASASGFRVALAAMLGAQEPRVRPLAGPGDGSSQPSRLGSSTVVALRLSADPAVALRLISEQRGQALIEPVAALSAQLATPVEVGIGLAPRADLNALVGGRAMAQPLRVARLEALAGLKDPAAFTAACDQLMALLGAPAGHGTWTMGGGDAEVAWAVQGRAVALSAGVAGGLPPLLARLQAGGRGFEPPAGTAGALAGGLGGLVLHGDNLVAALRALPPSAFGAGPDAVVGRSLVEKVIGSLGQGAALALRADLPAGALKLTLDLKLDLQRPWFPEVIRLTGITRSFVDEGREIEVLRGVDLAVSPGEVVAVIGASGSGKSTLLAIAGALDAGFGGEAVVAGQRLRGLSPAALARLRNRSIGFVFQSFNLVPAFPALENVLLPGLLRHGEGEPLDALRVRALAALDRVGLAGKAHARPARLSGGERQRVAIARALLTRPALLLADEPTGNLDAVTGEAIVQLFGDLAREGTAVLVVTHEERVSRAASRVLTLREGRLS